MGLKYLLNFQNFKTDLCVEDEQENVWGWVVEWGVVRVGREGVGEQRVVVTYH